MNTVLVVEDGVTDMEILSRYLQQAGYYVISATSSEEVQEKIDSSKPDLIFLDVILPGKSGFEICRELKNNPETSKIPIVFCSTKNSAVDQMWGNMLGAEGYLAKPINPAELVVTLNKLLK
ncbi:response regulator transcription factor [Nodularia sphaerocarpa]|uniref:response regulator transcription factor n=1 Tax=Nodularia sphaerocarpa TaxID=137816 RepID=UPI001EFC2639|nr:response regulator [Nodularia sphaerocarpa]MDB9374659.1 response regulator [Nodularia sphaerocarpa CS-585]MDB9379991.1 response regulator [Nodularia sphaerocarpa CS-585A2]ULP73067.1 Alkaline phosphatase synthesis transcriptional regulatory protein PhoP [Nodularia sphaerocarpa UHCC 0038]